MRDFFKSWRRKIGVVTLGFVSRQTGDGEMKSNKTSWILCALAIHLAFLPCIGDKKTIAQESDTTAVESLSVTNLLERVETALNERDSGSSSEDKGRLLERHLLELSRRSEPVIERRLKELLLKRQKELERLKADYDPKELQKRESLEDNLALLTALRRVQKRPDPLIIDVKVAKDYEKWVHNTSRYWFLSSGPEAIRAAKQKLATARSELDAAKTALAKISKNQDAAAWEKQSEVVKIAQELVDDLQSDVERRQSSVNDEETEIPSDFTAMTRELPILIARIKSADFERQAVFVTQGGDYRSGRHARWRIEVRDAKNQVIPMRRILFGSGGGMYQTGLLDFDESWVTPLHMADYVDLPRPGEYTVTLIYHNEFTIDNLQDPDDLEKLLVFWSQPFKLKVVKAAPRVIQLEPGSRDKAKSLIQLLPTEGAVKVLPLGIDIAHYEFIALDSAAGKLLQMDWQAVPELFMAINDPSRDRHQKAWSLSLLSSITHEKDLDPFDHVGAFGSLRWQKNATNYGSASARFSAEEQDSLIAKWNELKNDYLEFDEAE